jgi:PDZ domain
MIRASIFAVLLAAATVVGSGIGRANSIAQAHTSAPDADTSSSGWIDFTPYRNLGIYLPIKVNGHEAMAWLWGGPTSIDKNFAESIGLQPNSPDDGAKVTADVQLGNLTLRNASANLDELQAQAYAPLIGRPLTLRLGEEVFKQFVVDIDFARHRVAFRDPERPVKPAGAILVPLIELDGERVVPVSVDNSAPAQFELELGNMNGPLLVTPAYAETHKLLGSHTVSQRLSGPFSETVVSVDRLGFAGVDFRHAPIAIIPATDLPPASIAGGIGLPLLSHYRLIIDYSHSRLYAIANAAAATTPIAKDRIGLVLAKKDNDFGVAFVAPNSPAEAAGFKKGDKITLIDGKPFDAWARLAILEFHLADAGTTHAFTMPDGTVRHVKAADFF